MRIIVAFLVVAWLAPPALAGPKLLVLRAESTVDWETRTRVEDLVIGLARNVDRGVGQSETSFAAVTEMIGCKGDVAKCRGQVVDTLSVDEVVVIELGVASTGKIKVTVHRASKTNTRTATAIVERDNPDSGMIAAIGPLFGAKRVIAPPRAAKQQQAPPKGNVSVGAGVVVDNEEPPTRGKTPPTTPPPPAPAPPAPEPTPASKAPPAPAPTTTSKAPPAPTPKATPAPAPKTPPPTTTAAAEPTVTAAPDNVVVADARPMSGSTKIAIATIAGGGVLLAVGAVLWSRASSLEEDIASAPNRTAADVDALLEMEDDADRYALFGNITFVAGVAVAGVGGYLLWRSRRADSGVARITPVVFDHGGGVAFTWGAP